MQMCVVEMTDRPGKPLFHLEHYIEGKYIKYNSNSGFVRDDSIRLTPQVGGRHCFFGFPKLRLNQKYGEESVDLGKLYGRVARSVEELKPSFHIQSATSDNSCHVITIKSAESLS